MDFGLTSNGNATYCSISPPRLIREEMRGKRKDERTLMRKFERRPMSKDEKNHKMGEMSYLSPFFGFPVDFPSFGCETHSGER